MLTDEFCLDVLRALSGADRFGLSLSELAGRVWPGEADPRRHGVLGQALSELADKGLVLSSGGKRARYALAPEGDAWLRRFRVVPQAPAAARPAHAPTPADPIAAAIEALVDGGAPPPLPPDISRAEAYQRGRAAAAIGVKAKLARLKAACGDDAEAYVEALAEAQRRTAAQIAEVREEMLTEGIDPFDVFGP